MYYDTSYYYYCYYYGYLWVSYSATSSSCFGATPFATSPSSPKSSLTPQIAFNYLMYLILHVWFSMKLKRGCILIDIVVFKCVSICLNMFKCT